MNQLALLAIAAGGAIALQASMNAQLGVLLKNAMLATSVAFLCSCLFMVAALLAATKHYPQWHEVRAVPVYLWFSGGALSAFGVAMFYYLIPKMGVGSMMSYALSGQIIIAVLASHFGWFDLPVKPLSLVKLIGAATLILGVFLLNLEPSNGH